MNTQKIKVGLQTSKYDEHILVVKRNILFQNKYWQGLKKVEMNEYLSLIEKEKEFLPRSLMESDPTYKQIIPYLVFEYENKFFLMQRKKEASEQRLKNKYSLGIGGHIRKEDLSDSNIINWAKREFEEEINYDGTYNVEPIGILNDDSNPVGQVHIGFVLLLHGNTDKIEVKSELKSGQLFSLEKCKELYNSMESWSQIVFDYLIKEKNV